MTARLVLAAIDDQALETVASKGLLRRARRDVEAGLAELEHALPSSIRLRVDGETVAFGDDGLISAVCSCPAHQICRHILAGVLLLRAEPKSSDEAISAEDPIAELTAFSEAELVKAFGRAGLRDAETILATRAGADGDVTIDCKGRTCSIGLPGQPNVRFISGLGLQGMIAPAPAPIPLGDGKTRPISGNALKAAAVLAVRRLRGGPDSRAGSVRADARKATAAPLRAEAAFLDAVTGALAECARSSLAIAPLVLENRLLDLALSSRADSMPRLAGSLRTIATDLARRRNRKAVADPAISLETMARTYALTLALRRAGDDPILRGSLRQSYRDLPPVDLVGCGLDLWRTQTGARGARAHFIALEDPPGDGPVWYTATLARAAGQDPHFTPAHAARHEPVWGQPLVALAGTAFHLDGASATADCRLSTGGAARYTASDRGLAHHLARRPGLVVRHWSDIEARVAASLSPSLRARSAFVPLLLQPRASGPLLLDTVDQIVWLPIQDDDGRWIALTIDTVENDNRLEAVAAMTVDRTPSLIVVLATCEKARLVLSAIGMMATPDDPLVHLDLDAEVSLKPTSRKAALVRQAVRAGLNRGLGVLFSRKRGMGTFTRSKAAGAATVALLAAAQDDLLALAELGGRMHDPERFARMADTAARLDAIGLGAIATLLGAVPTSAPQDRPLRLLAVVHAMACHAALAPPVPFLERLDR